MRKKDKDIEDAVERSVSKVIGNLKFNTQSSGEIVLHPDAVSSLNTITEENTLSFSRDSILSRRSEGYNVNRS